MGMCLAEPDWQKMYHKLRYLFCAAMKSHGELRIDEDVLASIDETNDTFERFNDIMERQIVFKYTGRSTDSRS